MYEELVALLRRKYDKAPMVMEAAEAIEELGERNENWKEALKIALDYIPCWVSVEERLPSPEVEVLVFTRDGIIAVDKFFGFILGLPSFSGKGSRRVTHWMPLPEPPKEEA